MRYRVLPGVDREASVIAMGSTHFGTFVSEQETYDILDAYVALGGNFIDTARVYGDFENGIVGISEGVIGRWMQLRGNRESLIVETKGAHPPMDKMLDHRLDRDSIQGDMARSLEALQLDGVDLYYLHRDQPDRAVGGIMETLHSFVEAGFTRAIGASNWSADRILEANDYAVSHGLTPFTVNQPQWALANMQIAEDPTLVHMNPEMYQMHRQTGMACVPYSSQAKGFFIKLFEGGQQSLNAKVADRYLNPGNLRIYDALKAIHDKTGTSVGALALAYLTGQPFPTFPIVGVSKLSQVQALAEAGDAVLTDEDRAVLSGLAM
ncbi:aldo/keto reductase [Eubacteriales bacterium OttesenSCG-928-N13]|nr:aldo/keto reductase [Eubacteriales bacterium OttesenSCG-928-N13]